MSDSSTSEQLLLTSVVEVVGPKKSYILIVAARSKTTLNDRCADTPQPVKTDGSNTSCVLFVVSRGREVQVRNLLQSLVQQESSAKAFSQVRQPDFSQFELQFDLDLSSQKVQCKSTNFLGKTQALAEKTEGKRQIHEFRVRGFWHLEGCTRA